MYRNTRKKAANYRRLVSENKEVPKYYKIGMPSKYWGDQHFEFDDIKATRINGAGETETYYRKSAAKQKTSYSKLLDTRSFNESYLISISSDEIEDPAIAVASCIAKKAIADNFNVLFWNSGNFIPYEYAKEHDKIPDVVIIYNLTSESSYKRYEKVRDVLFMYEDSLRIVCSAGMDPVTFCEKKIRMNPDMVFSANKKIVYTVKKSY